MDGAVFQAPVDITFSATATDSDGTIAKVEFFDYDRLLGAVTQSPYQFTWTNVPPGAYFGLRAKATDNRGAASVSEIYIIVEEPLPSPVRAR